MLFRVVATGFAVVLLISCSFFSEALNQCTPRQATQDGVFRCLDGCDEHHVVSNEKYGPRKYCLNYFPDGGNCYMKPYTKPDILSCNGKAGGSNPPMWLIFFGGSNQYMMLKTMLDELLDLPGNAGFDPAKYWGAKFQSDDGKPPYSPPGIMDFVWDKNHNLIYKTTRWWDGLPESDISVTQRRFLEAPGPTAGSLRISFLNMHEAVKFKNRFIRVVQPGAPWLSANPRIHVYEEWSGMWDDSTIPQSVHEDNIQYLKGRQLSEGLNIASYVFTDSGPYCISGEQAHMKKVHAAMANVATSFPKYYFSKQNMMYNHFTLTNQCPVHGGHTMEPMNIVMWNRYMNLICNPSSPPPYQERIPVCVDLGDSVNTNDRCYGFGPDDKWMDNIMQVCLVNHKLVDNPAPCRMRSEVKPHQQKRRACKLQYAKISNKVVSGGEAGKFTPAGTLALASLMRSTSTA